MDVSALMAHQDHAAVLQEAGRALARCAERLGSHFPPASAELHYARVVAEKMKLLASALTDGWGTAHLERKVADDAISHHVWHAAQQDLAQSPFSAPAIQVAQALLSDLCPADALAEEQSQSVQFKGVLASVAHDVRSPIATARMALDLIELEPNGSTGSRFWKERAIANLDRVLIMLEDLLDARKIAARKELSGAFEPVELQGLVDEVCLDARLRHGDRFDCARGAPIHGFWCREEIRRALDNLLSNAVKYGSGGAKVTVVARQLNRVVRLSVHNEGNPIPAEEQGTLFVPFHRSRRAEHSGEKGWGIGLTLVHGIMEHHGGCVELESSAEVGTTFTLVFPLSLAQYD